MSIASYTIQLIEKKEIAPQTLLLTFMRPKGFDFTPGQFIQIEVEREEERKFRSYSILNGKQDTHLELAVKLISGGLASQAFKVAEPGQKFTIRGPFGHFVLDTSKLGLEHWFVCTGTGVAPFYSMIKTYLENHPHTHFTLLFGAKTQQDLLFRDYFERLAKQYDNFTYLPTLSQEQWSQLRGRVQAHLTYGADKIFYICGWKQMVLDTKDHLHALGVAKERIKFERYN